MRGAVEGGVGEFLEQDVGFAVEDAVALLDGGVADGLRRWLLPVPAGPRKSASSRWSMKRAVARSKTRVRFIFLLKVKSKLSSERSGSRKRACLRRRSSSRSCRRSEFVGDQRRDEVDGRHLFGLRLAQAGLQDVGHAGEAELAQARVEFDEVHVGSPVFWSMRSR